MLGTGKWSFNALHLLGHGSLCFFSLHPKNHTNLVAFYNKQEIITDLFLPRISGVEGNSARIPDRSLRWTYPKKIFASQIRERETLNNIWYYLRILQLTCKYPLGRPRIKLGFEFIHNRLRCHCFRVSHGSSKFTLERVCTSRIC